MGRIVTFYLTPSEAVVDGILQPNAVHAAGEVVGTFDVPPYGKGKIRNLGLLVRGRKKKKLRINLVEHYVNHHANWREADVAIKKASR